MCLHQSKKKILLPIFHFNKPSLTSRSLKSFNFDRLTIHLTRTSEVQLLVLNKFQSQYLRKLGRGHDTKQERKEVEDQGRRLVSSRAISLFPVVEHSSRSEHLSAPLQVIILLICQRNCILQFYYYCCYFYFRYLYHFAVSTFLSLLFSSQLIYSSLFFQICSEI